MEPKRTLLGNLSACQSVGICRSRDAGRPLNRSQHAVFLHRALQVNSLSHSASEWSSASGNPAAADRNSVPSGEVSSPRFPIPFYQPGLSGGDVLTLVGPDGIGSPFFLPFQIQAG